MAAMAEMKSVKIQHFFEVSILNRIELARTTYCLSDSSFLQSAENEVKKEKPPRLIIV